MAFSMGIKFRNNDHRSHLWRLGRNDSFCLAVIFIVISGLKFFWVANAEGPVVLGDETIYKAVAEAMFWGKGYLYHETFSYQYPPLYSIALVPAFLFGGDWYVWLLRVNVLISSTAVFPIWWIARRFLPRRESWLAVGLASLLPFHIAFPRVVMSENLFVPLALTAFALVLLDTYRPSVRQCLLTGAVWALAYLTRFIFLPVLPVFLLIWWLQPWVMQKLHWRDLFRGRLTLLVWLVLGFTLVYAPWFLYIVSQNADPAIAMGLRTLAGQLDPAILTSSTSPLNRMVFWITVCVAYLILAIAPFLPALFASLGANRKTSAQERYLFFAYGTTALAFGVTATYFMWQTQPNPRYIEGRYLTYLIPLIPIVALVAINRLRQLKVMHLRLRVWLGTIVSLGVIYAAYRLLISRSPLDLPPQFVGNAWSALDVMAFQASTIPLFGTTIRFLFVLLVLQAIFITWVSRYTAALMLTSWVIFSVVSAGIFAERVASQQELTRHGKAVAAIWTDYVKQVQTSLPVPVVVDANTFVTRGFAYYSLEFWGASNPQIDFRILSNPELGLPDFGLQLTTAKRLDPALSYRVWDQEFNAYILGFPSDDPSTLRIIDFGPKQASVGQPFNQQPDGSSAFWFKTQGAQPGTVLYFGTQPLKIDYSSPEFVTATILANQLQKPGTFTLYLFDPQTGVKSNTVTFTLRKK